LDQANPNPRPQGAGAKGGGTSRVGFTPVDKDRIMAFPPAWPFTPFWRSSRPLRRWSRFTAWSPIRAPSTSISTPCAALLPDGALHIIGDQVKRLSAKGNGALGVTAVASLLFSLWSANSGVKAVFDALDIAYEEEEKRSFLQLNLQSLAFTGGALLFAALALTGIVILPILLQLLGLNEKAWYIVFLRWPALLAVIMIGLATLYRYGPSRAKPEWRWVSWGAPSLPVMARRSGLFSWYVANFGSFDATYGSLGAVIGFMTWMWISTIVILLGAELKRRAGARGTALSKPPTPSFAFSACSRPARHALHHRH